MLIARSVHEAYSYGNKDSKNMSTANNATLFLSCRPHQLPVHEPQRSPTADGATSAAQEFALLEAWLASSRALQLPLHQIESQQQTRGQEVQRLLLQAHLDRRGAGDVGPALRVPPASLGSSPPAHNPACDSPRARKPTAREGPPWPRYSPALPGCVPQNRSRKACSGSSATLPPTARIPRTRRTSEWGPVCSKAKPPSSRR